MKINYTECMYDSTLLYGLATLCTDGGGCGSVSLCVKWIAEGNTNISCPLNFMIKIQGTWHHVVDSGTLSPDIDKTIALLDSLPDELVLFPNDKIEITADPFERELAIDLGLYA